MYIYIRVHVELSTLHSMVATRFPGSNISVIATSRLVTEKEQGAVTPIDAVVSAATGVTMGSQGHGGFAGRSRGHGGFCGWSQGHGVAWVPGLPDPLTCAF